MREITKGMRIDRYKVHDIEVVVDRLVIKEGILIGWTSCLLGALVSVPLGKALENELGRALLAIDLDYRFPVFGFVFWVLLATIVGIIGALAPATAPPASPSEKPSRTRGSALPFPDRGSLPNPMQER